MNPLVNIEEGLNWRGGLSTLSWEPASMERMDINPKTSYKIYQTYVIPRLLYSTETLTLTITQIQQFERFHTKTLKNLQSLPLRTSTSAVLLLIGALPAEAEIHRRQLSLIHAIVHANNLKLKNLMERQLNLYWSIKQFLHKRCNHIEEVRSTCDLRNCPLRETQMEIYNKDSNRSILDWGTHKRRRKPYDTWIL